MKTIQRFTEVRKRQKTALSRKQLGGIVQISLSVTIKGPTKEKRRTS